jgi:(p)ppGpp synthase/HD superfamily hydrolase
MESTRLQDARNFAIAMHGSQSYGAHPYSHHLDAVASILLPYGVEAQVIGWLHDVVEDTEATIADVRDRFGDSVARCVALLTDAPGANRAERKSKTYAKLASVSEDDELALIVKAADRLANVRACVTDTNRRLMNIYRDEHAVFRRAAYRPGLCDGMWSELDRLLDASS